MTNLLYKSFNQADVDLQLKVDLDKGQWQGYAAVFSVRDSGGDIIVPGAFSKSLVSRPVSSNKVKAMWDHMWIMGRIIEAREDEYGLFVKGQASNTQENKDRLEYMRDGSVNEMSIGYSIPPGGSDWHEDEDDWTITRILKEVTLYECSPVIFAMNELAAITGVAKHQELQLLLKSFGKEPLLLQAKSIENVRMNVVEEAVEALTAAHVEIFGDDETKRLFARMQAKSAAGETGDGPGEREVETPGDKETTEEGTVGSGEAESGTPGETPDEVEVEPQGHESGVVEETPEGEGDDEGGEKALGPEEQKYLQELFDTVALSNFSLDMEVSRMEER